MRTFGLGLQLGMGNVVTRSQSGGGGLAFSALVQSLNPWGYWQLDETGTLTTHADSSGNGRTATWSGTAGTASSGLIAGSTGAVTTATVAGQAGTTDQFLADHATTQISGICLIRTTENTGTPVIMSSFETNTTRSFRFSRNGSLLEFTKEDAGGIKARVQGHAGQWNDGGIHLIGFSFDPNLSSDEVVLYCDNLTPVVGSRTATSVSGVNTSVVTLMGARSSVSYSGAAEYDEIALWKGKALTEAEFLSLYEATGLGV